MEIPAEEGRVLGCLVERQLVTPQLYPLTENALLTVRPGLGLDEPQLITAAGWHPSPGDRRCLHPLPGRPG